MLEINNKTDYQLDETQIHHVVEAFLEKYKRSDYSVSLAIVHSQEMQSLNFELRGLDKVTDVLSFESLDDDFPQESKSNYLGEIVICYEKIKEQANIYSESVEEEFFFILVHGLLHLLGYSDEDEAGRGKMEKLGREFIKNLGN